MGLKYSESPLPPPSYVLSALSISACSTWILSHEFFFVLGYSQRNLLLLLVGNWCHEWERPLRDLCLNTWFPVSDNLGRIRRCGFSERATSLVDDWTFKILPSFWVHFFLPSQGIRMWALSCPILQVCCLLPHCTDMVDLYSSET